MNIYVLFASKVDWYLDYLLLKSYMNYQFFLERIHKDICKSIHPPYPYGGHIFPMIEPLFMKASGNKYTYRHYNILWVRVYQLIT